MTGVLEWNDTESSGKAARGDEASPSVPMTSSTLRWVRSQLRMYVSGLKAEQGQVTLQ